MPFCENRERDCCDAVTSVRYIRGPAVPACDGEERQDEDEARARTSADAKGAGQNNEAHADKRVASRGDGAAGIRTGMTV
jgi:hypothetical protein